VDVPTSAVDRGSPLHIVPITPNEWEITLDGEQVRDVVAASTPEGWIERFARVGGKLQANAAGNGVVIERLTGEVRIRYRPREEGP